MWNVDGDYAFGAVAHGAATVTGLDVVTATPEFLQRNDSLGNRVRFVQGDINDSRVAAVVGPHDVVFCSGVLYHVPHPLLTLERLRSICKAYLILTTATISERRAPQGAVFFPFLDDRGRRFYNYSTPGRAKVGLDREFVPEWGYANYYWGFTPSCAIAMLRLAGFRVLEQFLWRRGACFLCVPADIPEGGIPTPRASSNGTRE
ncbi:MAG: methyltransferase domain-containing protein [bacterium]|nr:methyltransferase domain-containing protein [bacterium]